MGSNNLKFKRIQRVVANSTGLALVVAALSGCAGVTMNHVSGAGVTGQTPRHMIVATPATDHDVLAQLVDAQFALDHGDLHAAAAAYGRAAAVSTDPAVAKRATRLAITTHDEVAAQRALARWQALGASDADLTVARARLALDTGNTAGARTQLEALTHKGSQDAWRKFAHLLRDTRDAAQAGKLLQSVATPARLPNDDKVWLAMSELGTVLRQNAYARQIATQAVTRFQCADCYAWAASLAYEDGHADKALALFKRAVAKAPNDTRLRLGYATALGRQGKNASAARLLAAGPQTTATYQARAAFAARASDTAQLQRIYHQLEHAPDDIRTQNFYLLGQLADTLGHKKKALDWYAQVPVDAEHRFDADLQRASLWGQTGEPARAHALMRQMRFNYAQDPDQLHKVLRLDAALYMSEHRFTQAAQTFSHALQQAPDDPDLLYGRGLAYAEAGKVDAAVTDLRRLLALQPDNIDAMNALGYTLADANRDLDEAETLLKKAHKARPDDPAITDSWGWLQYRLGHLAKAEVALQKAWTATASDPEIGLHLAEVLWKQGHLERARKVLTKVRKVAPDDPALRALEKRMTS